MARAKDLLKWLLLAYLFRPGIIITTEACNEYRRGASHFPEGLKDDVLAAMKLLGEIKWSTSLAMLIILFWFLSDPEPEFLCQA